MKKSYIYCLSLLGFFVIGCSGGHCDTNILNNAFSKRDAYTEEDYWKLVSYYNTQYFPKRKHELNVNNFPNFPLEYIKKHGSFSNSQKYDFLAGAFIGWYDVYMGQTVTKISGRDVVIDGYYYGRDEAVKELKKAMTPESKKYLNTIFNNQPNPSATNNTTDKKDGAEKSNK
jgi:hypothetical protein